MQQWGGANNCSGQINGNDFEFIIGHEQLAPVVVITSFRVNTFDSVMISPVQF